MRFNMKYRFIYIIFFTVITCVLSAQEKSPAGSAQNDQPIGLIADKGFYDQEKGIAIYEGNVVVTQEEMVIWTDKLTIILIDGEASHIEAESDKGGKISRFEFKGKGKSKLIKGSSRRIDYEVANKLVTLTTDAIVIDGDDEIIGDKLTYNLNNANIGGSRIKMTFSPTKK